MYILNNRHFNPAFFNRTTMPERLFGLNKAQEFLLKTQDFTLLRIQREGERRDCLYKINNAPHSASTLAYEYALMRDATLPCMPIVLGIEELRGELALMMELPKSLENGFRTMRDVCKKQRSFASSSHRKNALNIGQILDLMRICTAGIEELHKAGIVHTALMPEHILCSLHAVEPSSILDFADISLIHFVYALQKEGEEAKRKAELYHPLNTAPDADLRYIAPEQTGRVNRDVDYRTDLYALGCIFYEILAGKAPFEEGTLYSDTLAMLHAHVAVEPIPPHGVNDSVPEELSCLVMKLLRKNPDERYQSAEGLRRELEGCLELWRNKASLQGFAAGSKDRSDTFRISQKLIGREKESTLLREVFEKAARGKPHLVLLGGYAGAGKTALVRELQKNITARSQLYSNDIFPNGIFLSGKFDQVKHNIPYSALLQCMEDFATQVVSESARAVETWKDRIGKALGNNGSVLTDAFPALERILGEQPPVQDVGAQEAQNRFRLVMESFFGVLACAEHPLVVFLDDMQWADTATISLLANIVKASVDAPLLVICAFRSNEADERDLFLQTALHLESEGIAVLRTELGALSEEDVQVMVAETLASKPDEIKDLAHSVYEKTEGNPLFLVQLLQSLHRAGAIWFDRATFAWKWRNEAVSSASIADNVVDLMTQRLRELFPETQRIVQLAASVGNRFETDILSIISETSPKTVLEGLHRAEQVGLIQSLEAGNNNEKSRFAFVHDRVQQAGYGMIPEAERNTLHLSIARLLQRKLTNEEREERLFDLTGHYNKALSLLRDDNEREAVAILNLTAARKAKRSAVYGAAAEYIEVFRELTHDVFWQTHYDMMREASIIGAEVGYATENSALLEFHSTLLMQYGRTLIDRVQGEKVRIEAYSAQGRYAEAVAVGKYILSMFGVVLPNNPTKLSALLYLLKLRNSIALLQKHPNAGQERTPSGEQQEVMNILMRFTVPAIAVAQNLLPAIVYHACAVSLKHGLVANSGYFLFIAGIIMRSLFSNHILADHCLKAGIYYAQRNGEEHPDVLRGQVSYAATAGYWYSPPSENMRQIVEWEHKLFAVGVEEEATYCALHYSAEGLQSSLPLSELTAKVREKISVVHKKRVEISIYAAELWYQVIMRLQESMPKRGGFTTLDGEFFLEKDRFRTCEEKNNFLILGYSYCHKIHLAVLSHQFSKAVDFFRQFNKYKDTGTVSSLYHWQHLYLGLAYSSLVKQGEKRYWGQFKRVLKIVRRWAGWSKMFHHRYQCLQAELLMHNSFKHDGNTDEAESWFQKAIASAQSYGFLGDKALIAERAGIWFHHIGNAAKAREYLRTAYSFYGEWGAFALQAMMREQYTEYVGDILENNVKASPKLASEGGVSLSSAQTFDMLAVMKSSQAIAGEIDFARLLEKMLRVTAESSGAQRVVLLRNEHSRKEAELIVEAELKTSGDVVVLKNIPLAAHNLLPKSVIEHSAVHRETVILRHAAVEGGYANNSYLSANHIKSVLSLPILNQGKLVGVLYAENNLMEDAFTGDRVQILTMLSSQMAISIENALLVESMTKMERLKKEMEMAAEVQLQMLPKEFPEIPGYEIAAFLSMAEEAGGDFYDVLPLGKARYLLVIGDVSGKGMPAALFMSAMVNTVRTQVKYLMLAEVEEFSPKRILEIANAMARQSMTRRNFVTMMAAVLDAEKHTLTFSTAGHDPAMKWNPAERSLEQLRTDGIACNFGSEDVFAAKTGEITIAIERGAMVFWNTDGITEAKNERTEEFRNERYWSAIMDIEPKTRVQTALERIVDRVRAFQGTKAQYDDMTLLAIKRIG